MKNRPIDYIKNQGSWKKPISNCDPMIIQGIGLMSGDGSFINELDLSERCKCKNKETCREILFALRSKDNEKAMDLYQTLSHDGINS